jgi:hypothetical protein
MNHPDADSDAIRTPRKNPSVPGGSKSAADYQDGLILVTLGSEHVELSADAEALNTRAESSLSKEVAPISGRIDDDACAYFHLGFGSRLNSHPCDAVTVSKYVQYFGCQPNGCPSGGGACGEMLIDATNIHDAHEGLIITKCGGSVRRDKSNLFERVKK